MSKQTDGIVEIKHFATGPLLAVLERNDPAVRETKPHLHTCGQLFGTMHGLVAVGVNNRQWIVPAGHAVWIPPHLSHFLQSYGPLQSWSIYLDEDASRSLPMEPCTMRTSGLLDEATRRVSRWESVELTEAQQRITQVILDEIYSLPHEPPGLPMPADIRALRVAHALTANLSDNRRINEWAHWTGASSKTLSRHFIDETGMTFGQWRQQARMMRALEMLTADWSVTSIALELGYETTSAFIAMFKRARGVTPGQYYQCPAPA